MTKTRIVLICLILTAAGVYLLSLFYPSVVWYYVFDDQERRFTALQGEKLDLAIVERARDAVRRIDSGESLGDEEKYLKKQSYMISPEEKAAKKEAIAHRKRGEEVKNGDGDPDLPEIELLSEFYRDKHGKNQKIKRAIVFKTRKYYEYFPKVFLTLEAAVQNREMYGDEKELSDTIKTVLIRKVSNVGKVIDISRDGSFYTVVLEDVLPDLDFGLLFSDRGKLDFKVVSRESTEMISGFQEEASAENRSIVDEQGRLLAEYLDRLPPGIVCLKYSDFFSVDKDSKGRYLAVEEKQLFPRGFLILESSVSTTPFGQSVIQLSLDEIGARRFGEITEANIGRQIAIVIDGFVVTAPVVQEKISFGRLQLTLGNAGYDKLIILAGMLKTENQNISFKLESVK